MNGDHLHVSIVSFLTLPGVMAYNLSFNWDIKLSLLMVMFENSRI